MVAPLVISRRAEQMYKPIQSRNPEGHRMSNQPIDAQPPLAVADVGPHAVAVGRGTTVVLEGRRGGGRGDGPGWHAIRRRSVGEQHHHQGGHRNSAVFGRRRVDRGRSVAAVQRARRGQRRQPRLHGGAVKSGQRHAPVHRRQHRRRAQSRRVPQRVSTVQGCSAGRFWTSSGRSPAARPGERGRWGG